MYQQRGFTLVELVMVIIIAGMLATYALPRFFSKDNFENRGFYTEVLNAVRYAQQLAVAINCNTQVSLTNNGYTVSMATNPNDCSGGGFGPAPDPVTGQIGFTNSSTSVNDITPATFQFTALGTASTDTTITVGGYRFRVYASTGYIEEI